MAKIASITGTIAQDRAYLAELLETCRVFNRQYRTQYLAPANLYGANDNYDPATSTCFRLCYARCAWRR
jgi:hypothetical protein